MTSLISTKKKLIDNLKSSNNESKLILSLNFIINEIIDKGIYSGIIKKEIINISNTIRNRNINSWTKNVAILFGKLLKLLKKINKIDTIFKKKCNKEMIKKNIIIIGNSNFRNVINKLSIYQIACGGTFFCCLDINGNIYSFGEGNFGQLGRGDICINDEINNIKDIPKCKSISCGYAFSCALTCDKYIYSWGASENGRLGIGILEDEIISKPMKTDTNIKFNNVYCGSVHTCAISVNNELYSWGNNKYTGHNDNDVFSPKKINSLSNKYFRMLSIGLGGYHTIGLTLSNQIYIWGHNRVGQLGINNTDNLIESSPILLNSLLNNIVISIKVGWGHSMILFDNGEVYIFGRKDEGQL